MDRGQVHETVNELLEAEFDQRDAIERLGRFSETYGPLPATPREFENMAAFLNFYEAKRRYEAEFQNLENRRDEAKKSYSAAERTLRNILPENTPLHYTYEGNRQELAGRQFTIVNRHLGGGRGQITIASWGPTSG
jgi:hypothetical protein